ncbi:MAG: phosphopentomutase [Lentisphaerae bacterium]|nr:phosphopentomutase [Lentisphaerota bacterium]
MRAFLIVLDSVGIGEAPDAGEYGDEGANTLAHCAEAAGGLNLPVMQAMGLGNIPALLPRGPPIRGVPAADNPTASFGAMQEVSKGKDTTTGHWEMAGLALEKGFHLFPKGPPSFPDDLIASFEQETGRRLIGNKAASGTAIIAELGAEHMRTGALIAYTSADSVFQVAAHEEVVPLPALYAACETARRLCDKYPVGRVIARPFVGAPGAFTRTNNRRDFSYPPPEPTILDRLSAAGVPVVTVGKLDDVFAHRGMTESVHAETSSAAAQATLDAAARLERGFVFTNLIDFDMLYGHRRDAAGYANALAEADAFLGRLLKLLRADDLLLVTADHGNDPTFKGTDHTREFVPLLAYRPSVNAGRPATFSGRGQTQTGARIDPARARRSRATSEADLGIRHGFYDVAQTLAAFFGIASLSRGKTLFPRSGYR